jgi:hypothetical protein
MKIYQIKLEIADMKRLKIPTKDTDYYLVAKFSQNIKN